MTNPGQPTIGPGASGSAVRQLQRALHRVPMDVGMIDGAFGPATEALVHSFQSGSGILDDGIVGPMTWADLPDGDAMPMLQKGSHGPVVKRLQEVIGASGAEWGGSVLTADGVFGSKTQSQVKIFEGWGHVGADGIVGDNTWAVALHALGATLESVVGLP
jgi:peptidoglycan hydrolase-like protein with peptidoglycan-binding domain